MRSWRWYVVRLELAAAIVAAGVVALVTLAPPNTMGGGGRPLDWWITWVGIAGVVVGFVVMIRVYRADPEAHPSDWRSVRA